MLFEFKPALLRERAASDVLRERAAEALRQARRLPVGPERNELRQVAVCLRWLADKQERDVIRGLPRSPFQYLTLWKETTIGNDGD